MGCVTVFVYSMDMAELVLGVQSVLNLADIALSALSMY